MATRPHRGRLAVLVAFEGPDAAGLTTHSRLVASRLGAVYTKEPTESAIGKIIRAMLAGSGASTAEELALLFAADRMRHLYGEGGVLEKLIAGQAVVMDRYKYSSIAYQSVRHPGLGSADTDWLWEINKYAPPPHILVYLHASPEELEKRLQERRSRQLYEHRALLEEVTRSFRENVLTRLPETCSPRAAAWGRRRVRGIQVASLYPEGYCYPLLVTADTTTRTIDEVNREIMKKLTSLLKRLHQ